jgi:hypothetical protein
VSLPVWLYWEGDCPEWIAACRTTIERHASELRSLGPEDVDRLRSGDPDAGDLDLAGLCTAHRADIVRAFLLARFGGIWVDADSLVMHSLDQVAEWTKRWGFVGYKERQGHVANNFMAAVPADPIAAAYLTRVVAILRSGQELSWLSLGAHALTDAIRESGRSWLRLGYELVQPVCWSNPAAFFAEADNAEHERGFNDRSLCYMLSNNMVQGYVAANPGADLLGERTFFRFLLRKALGEDEVGPERPPRRSGVGTSNWQQIPFCVEALLDLCPMRVLDVGIGFGRWGMLVREFCEEWKGRIHRENWGVRLEGIEAFPKNVEEYHHLFYDWVHVGDAAEIIEGMTDRWDLILFGDVLEHFPKEQGQQVLGKARELSRHVLVNIPIGPGWERGGMYDNPWEEHKSSWDLEEFMALEPVRHAVFTEYNGRAYGAFLLAGSGDG